MPRNKLIDSVLEADELLALARLNIEKGDVEQGLLKLKQILALDEPPSEAVVMMARLYAQLRLFSRSQALFKQYLEMNSEAELELFQLGMTYFESGEQHEALQVWDRLLKTHTTHPPALFYKALCLAKDGNIADARQTLTILMQAVHPDNMYFTKGKELLTAMERGPIPDGASVAAADESHYRKLPKGAYQTEH